MTGANDSVSHPFSLRGRLALVTGAGRGLGFEIARSLGLAGAEILLNGRNEAALAASAASLASFGISVTPLPFDIADFAAVSAAFAGIAAARGRLDILVGTVGRRRRAPLDDLSVADFRGMVETKLTAGYALAKAALPLMLPHGHGRILLVTSIAGPIARSGDAAYTAAKGGLAALVRALAVELGPSGIAVNGIAPGYFATVSNAAMIGDPDVQDFLDRRCPLRRWGRPDEIGGAAIFLASDAASYVNGHILTIDGGLSASF